MDRGGGRSCGGGGRGSFLVWMARGIGLFGMGSAGFVVGLRSGRLLVMGVGSSWRFLFRRFRSHR